MTNSEGSGPTGRVMKFIHEGESKLPVRDVKGNYKADPANEPYIEYGLEEGSNGEEVIGAENYWAECYQDAIKKVVDFDEEYLFLASYPHYGDADVAENSIVGFIQHDDHEWRSEDRVAVIGRMKLYPFEHSIPLSEFDYEPTKRSLSPYGRNLDESQTQEVLDHFRQFSDITEECLERTLELEGENDPNRSNKC